MGGRLPQLAYEAHLAGGALNVLADGRFEGFNPATLVNRKELDGNVTGTLNVNVQLADITAPITPEAITADGTRRAGAVDGRRAAIDNASVEGKYAAQVGDLKRLQVNGPDVKVDASGRVALDRTSASNLKYHVEAIDLAELARLAGQTDVDGSAVLDGTVTGNAASLQTTGTLDGSNLGYRENKALDLEQQVHRDACRISTSKQARVEADTDATFVKAGGWSSTRSRRRRPTSSDRLQFTTNIKEEKRELDATGERDPPSRSSGSPPAAARGPHAGRRVEDGAGHRGDRQVRSGPRAARERALSSGDQSLDVNGAFALQGESPAGAVKVQARNVDLQQLETLLLTEPRPRRASSPRTRRSRARRRRRSSTATSRSSTAGSRATSTSR